jgi:RNA polymerase sigma-70 factor (ECF subfamily)
VDSTSNSGDLNIPVSAGEASTPALSFVSLPPDLLEELWQKAEAETLGLTQPEFGQVLVAVGAKTNHGLPPGATASPSQRAAFFRGLRLPDLALAHACALGREPAWERFLSLHRGPLVRAAQGITGSASLGEDLADSLYAELYGLREVEGQRKSPLSSFTGRGSLLGWLRTTLAQRFTDHHRRTHREAPLEDVDSPAPAPAPPIAFETNALTAAVASTLAELDPEDRFLLAAYYLDRQTLLQIARTINVHEATISRRLKRLLEGLRIRLLKNLCAGGLSRAAAQEALGTDPRDIEINLRALLQTSQTGAFKIQGAEGSEQGAEGSIQGAEGSEQGAEGSKHGSQSSRQAANSA